MRTDIAWLLRLVVPMILLVRGSMLLLAQPEFPFVPDPGIRIDYAGLALPSYPSEAGNDSRNTILSAT